MRIPLSQIVADPANNLRGTLNGIPELAESIKNTGLLQPLIVSSPGDDAADARYILRAGFRRHAALMHLGAKEVDVVVTDSPGLVVNLVENINREDITPYDFATALMRLADEGYTGAKLTKFLSTHRTDGYGTSRSNINNLIRLRRELPEGILNEWQAGHHAASVGNLITILGDKNRTQEARIEMWNRIIGAAPDVDDAEPTEGEAGEPADPDALPPAAEPKRRSSKDMAKMLGHLEDLAKKGDLSVGNLGAIEATFRWAYGHSEDIFGVNLADFAKPKKAPKEA